MTVEIIFLSAFLVSGIYLLGREMEKRLALELHSRARVLQEDYERLIEKQQESVAQRHEFERQAEEIFSLYEMTKELTKHFKESEVFDFFRRRLHERVKFRDCRIVDAVSDELQKLQAEGEYFAFSLQWEGSIVGYLVVTGVTDSDGEKINILGHQLALALRRARLYEEVERLATTDSLTQVFTRRHFMERYEEEIRRCVARRLPLSFLMIDVDHFKEFNDRHGHLVGDQILREMARIISGSIREIDLMGRYGGEEFCVALAETETPGAVAVAERIRAAVEAATIKAYDTTLSNTLSIGIASFPRDALTGSELVDKADWALYRAKQSGRNRVCAVGVYGPP